MQLKFVPKYYQIVVEIPKQIKDGAVVKESVESAKQSATVTMGSSFLGNMVLSQGIGMLLCWFNML